MSRHSLRLNNTKLPCHLKSGIRNSKHPEDDLDIYKAEAKREAGIEGWEKSPKFGSIPDYTELIKSNMPPVDASHDI